MMPAKGKLLFKEKAIAYGMALLLLGAPCLPCSSALASEAFSSGAQNTESINSLATKYYMGNGVPQDYRKAAELFLISARRGNAIAQYNVGYMFQHGTGVQLDYFKAGVFCQAAADQGIEGAVQSLKELQQYMSPDKIAEIERIAANIEDYSL